jgi:hypothetical protein
MTRLTRSQLAKAIAAMETASAAQRNGDTAAWQRWYDREGQRPATVEFPLGELLNEAIRGYVAVWYAQGRIAYAGIGSGDGFAAQGLEGKAVVTGVGMATALLVARDLPPYRCNVYAEGRG